MKSNQEYIMRFLDKEFEVKHRKFIAIDGKLVNNFRAIVNYVEAVFGFKRDEIYKAVKHWGLINGWSKKGLNLKPDYSESSPLFQLLEEYNNRELTDEEITAIHNKLNETNEYVNGVINRMTTSGHELVRDQYR